MNGFAFRKNATFEWNGANFRVRENSPTGELLLEAVETGAVSLVPSRKLLTEYTDGRLRPSSLSTPADAPLTTYARPLEDLKADVRAEIHRRLHYLKVACLSGPPVFTAAYLGPLITQAAAEIHDEKPPSISSVYRWLQRYRLSGSDARSLIPRIDRRGRRHPRQDAQVLQLLADAVADAYRSSPRATTQNIYSRLIAKVEAANRQLFGDDALKVPSIRTTYRLLHRAEAYDMITLREGRHAADRRLRIVGAGAQTTRILERIEIDHTPLDLFLIDERTWLPCGRPTLTLAIDHFSRMPFGYYLSYSPPSAAAVVGALRHGIRPKTLCTSALPDLSVENDWPVFGLIESLVVDNGLEFHGVDLDGIALDLGFTIVYCPKRTPRFKGTIERYLKTINYFFAHQLPGTSMARLEERGDYDPQKHALLTLGEFKQILEKWFVDVYAETIHRGLGTTPRRRWLDGALARAPELPNLDQLKTRIGKTVERKIRRSGLELNGIRYGGEAIAVMLRRYGEGVSVRVVYDPEDLGEIHVWGPDEDSSVAVPALDFEYAKGLTTHQHEMIREAARAAGADAEDRAAIHRARAEIADQIESLMVSRKLRARRRSAVLRGINSSKPAGTAQQADASPPKPTPTQSPNRTPERVKDDLPPLLTSFSLRLRKGA